MSGYLMRIAQRALNQAPAVHANASLPFVVAPEPMAAEAFPQDADAGRAPEHADPLRVRVVPEASMDEAHPPARSEISGQAIQVTVPPAPTRGHPPPSVEPLPARTRNGGNPGEPSRHADVVRSSPIATRPMVDERMPARTPMPPAAAPVLHSRTEPASARGVPAAAARPNDRLSSARDAPAPDVHIHIGRIELTALPEPAAPRRPSKAAKTPMSLDEYLKRRGGGAT
jgi:hypothetical protein